VRPHRAALCNLMNMSRQQAPWGRLAIASMWIAVLFVGLWGGDIVGGANAAAGTSGSTVPVVVVVVAPCALLATIVVAQRAFGGGDDRS
jgi:hypothetical protein